MKIKFLTDYQGRETAMRRVEAGGILEIDQQAAIELIKFGIAIEDDTELINVQTMSEEKPHYIGGRKAKRDKDT